jgi:thymidylate synthase
VLNPAFALAETIWILSGSDDPWIYQFNAALRGFTDDGVLQGAYGPRMRRWGSAPGGIAGVHVGVVDQLGAVLTLLRDDPDSRRAVIQLFDPARDFLGHRDVPCTLGYRFYLRGGRLHMHTSMRSQDLWLGFAYDVFAATVLQELLAGWLGADVGEYHHYVDSLHLYEPVLRDAARLPSRVAPSELVEIPEIAWEDLDRVLRSASDQEADADPDDDVGHWDEARLVLGSYRMWKSGDREAARTHVLGRAGTMTRALCRWYERLDERSGRASGDRQAASTMTAR